ncbi:MAG TPA: glutamate formimidoyltransferase [Terriglobia bacterium]|nr:glutamate formimidoyltransferase [Terriglobia bacterium]
METLVECVPNFSEGRDAAKVEAIIQALLAGPGVYLLDREMDADHHRSVITLVGTPKSIGEAALRGIGRAAELIDLNQHRGVHPRLGATDVVPFVPVRGVTLDDCVRIAEWVAEETWRRFKIPTYLYEAAARLPERRNLENIRRGQFEGAREEVLTHPERVPDFGPKFGEGGLHPSAGATVVGARKFLIAYNINLATPDTAVAKAIAKKIRASSGGFPSVKAMGVDLKARSLAQVSMNLTDFETTGIGTVFDAVRREAAAQGVEVAGSEIVGLVPRRALEDAAVHYLKVENFHPDLILENRLDRVLAEKARPAGEPLALSASRLAEAFLAAVAAPTPTPGGGSVSALAGALAAALAEMVSGLTLKRKSFAAHHPAIEESSRRLHELRQRLLENVDRDAASYNAVVTAMRLPKSTAAEQAARERAIGEASQTAAEVPLETAERAAEVESILEDLRSTTIPQAASDLTVALELAHAARRGALENVRVNLPAIVDPAERTRLEAGISELERPAKSVSSTGAGMKSS